MKDRVFTVVVLLVILVVPAVSVRLLAQTPAVAAEYHDGGMAAGAIGTESVSAAALRAAMRKLWEEHIETDGIVKQFPAKFAR